MVKPYIYVHLVSQSFAQVGVSFLDSGDDSGFTFFKQVAQEAGRDITRSRQLSSSSAINGVTAICATRSSAATNRR